MIEKKRATETTVTKAPAKTVNPGTVRGLSPVTVRANTLPGNIGPARLGGAIVGQVPAGTLLPSNVIVTQGYHPGHYALDLAGPNGDKVYAPVALKVLQAGKGAFGLDVIGVNPKTGIKYTFGHFQSVANIPIGSVVPAGTLLGLEGSTFTAPGYSTGPHVHFQENGPTGNPVLPTAADVLQTFVGVPVKRANETGKSNTTLIAAGPDVKTSTESGAAVAAAVPTVATAGGGVGVPIVTKLASENNPAGGTIIPMSDTGTTAATKTGKVLGSAFLGSHSAIDYVFIVGGSLAIIFGLLFLAGSWMKDHGNPQKWQLDLLGKLGGVSGVAEKAAAI